jgi:Tfp pilus assembly protein PilN
MALYQLNLLPPRIRQERARRLTQFSIVAAVLFVLALPVGWWYSKWSAVASLKARVIALDEQKKPHADKIRKLYQLKIDEAALVKKLKLLDQLVKRQSTWIRLLEGIGFSQSQVQDLWLTNLTSTAAKAGANAGKIEVTVKGMAFSLASVHEFAKVLKDSDLELEVGEIQMSVASSGGERVIAFTTKIVFKA